VIGRTYDRLVGNDVYLLVLVSDELLQWLAEFGAAIEDTEFEDEDREEGDAEEDDQDQVNGDEGDYSSAPNDPADLAIRAGSSSTQSPGSITVGGSQRTSRTSRTAPSPSSSSPPSASCCAPRAAQVGKTSSVILDFPDGLSEGTGGTGEA